MPTRGTLIYIGQRVLLIGFTLFIVSLGVFIAVHSLPGNAFVTERVNGQALQDLLHQYGLDRPVLVQYWDLRHPCGARRPRPVPGHPRGAHYPTGDA